jgi:hypothetical protein
VERARERERVDFKKNLSLNFLFSKAKPLKLFFIGMQGWVSGNFP